jgi:hypothetical protein
LHELADAHVQAAERFLLFQDADFEYQRVRLNLLRATGDLENWALPVAATKQSWVVCADALPERSSGATQTNPDSRGSMRQNDVRPGSFCVWFR